jgi:hypothetical protein
MKNPNPNQLFGVIDIDSIQYKNIIYGLSTNDHLDLKMRHIKKFFIN